MADEAKIRGRAWSRAKPTPGQQGESIDVRLSPFGEAYVRPVDRYTLAEEGSYFIAHNTTNDLATTLAGHAAPVLADADDTLTKPFLFLRVPNAATKSVQLDFIEIEVVTAGAAGTQACWTAQLDTGTTRWSSGGTALTIVNPNMQSVEPSILAATNHLLAGPVVASAETTSCRVLGFGTLRPSIEIAGDIKMFTFGRDPAVVGTQAGQAAAAIRTSVVALPPVVLGATDSFLLALHGQASQSAAGIYKVRMGWSERTQT
jgi:hypothetical protein